jgi:hypothetical protein
MRLRLDDDLFERQIRIALGQECEQGSDISEPLRPAGLVSAHMRPWARSSRSRQVCEARQTKRVRARAHRGSGRPLAPGISRSERSTRPPRLLASPYNDPIADPHGCTPGAHVTARVMAHASRNCLLDIRPVTKIHDLRDDPPETQQRPPVLPTRCISWPSP